VQDPSLAANLLSAVCTSLAVGLLCVTAIELTDNAYASGLAALALACSPLLWERAVVCEINNVNLLFVALTLWLMFRWARQPSLGRLAWAATAYGLSLGSYLANLLFLPGILYLLARRSKKRIPSAAIFLLIAATVGAVLLSWSIFRSRTLPPIGTEHIPYSLGGFLRYLTGLQYKTTALHDIPFYLQRIAEHTLIFSKGFLGLGLVLGLLGLWAMWIRHPVICQSLILIFALDMGFFTGFAVWEYAYLVTPSYFIFALWIACGVAFLLRPQRRLVTKAATLLLTLLLVVGLFVWKLPVRLARRDSRQVTEFVQQSFWELPEDAVVVSAWRRFAPLLFYQKTTGQRPDLTLIERQDAPRHYSFGTVDSWSEYVNHLPESSVVFIDRADLGPASIRVLREAHAPAIQHQRTRIY